MSTLSDKDREELSQLLPWYANGTLDAEDSLRVEAALESDDALAQEFDLILEDQAAMIELVSEEEVPASMPERFKAALHAEINAPAPRDDVAQTTDGFLSRIFSALFPAEPRAYAAAAALVALLLPAVAIVSYDAGNQSPAEYSTASGDDPVATDSMRMLVKFKPDASMADIDAFLADNNGAFVKGPTPDGFYELEFETNEGLADTIGAATEIFEFALPAN
ncbi:MAG: hypothetical protein AAGL23_11790 [Pseudomonadota bacterium]